MTDNRTIAERYIHEFWNEERFEVPDQICTSDHAYHDPNLPDLPLGPEGVKERRRIYKEALPGRVTQIHDWLVDGDRVVCHWTYEGVNSGSLGDLPPTGKNAVVEGMHLWHFRDGRIAESWVMWDRLGLLEQLGLT
jgi:steroid delta-isomerase-like uncharacterized protein